MTGHHPRPQALPAERAGGCCPPRPRRSPAARSWPTRFRPRALDAAFRLFRAALAPLAEAGKLGYVLFQFAPWVHFEPTRGSTTWPRCRRGCRAGRWPWSSAIARGFPTTPTRRCARCARPGSPTSIVDAPAVGRRGAARDGGDRADGGPAAARAQRGGLAAPAPRRGAGVREKYDYLYTRAPSWRALVPEIDGAGRRERGGLRLLQQQQPRLSRPQRAR